MLSLRSIDLNYFVNPPTWHLNQTAKWHPEPTVRGTYSLVSSCILTLGICVWSAVHVEISAPGRKKAQWGLKVLLVIIGMLTPEGIAFIALSERVRVSRLTKKMQPVRTPSKWKIRSDRWKLKIRDIWRLFSGRVKIPEEEPVVISPLCYK
jgi:hypothetical protein